MAANAPFVEVGRVCQVNYGRNVGKLCVVLDVLDQNTVLVDGPSCCTGVPRRKFPLKRLNITHLKVQIPRGARLKTLRKAFQDEKILEKFAETTHGRKLALQQRRLNLTDFDRFKVMILKKKKSQILRKHVIALRRAAATSKNKTGGKGKAQEKGKGKAPQEKKAKGKAPQDKGKAPQDKGKGKVEEKGQGKAKQKK